MVRLVVLAFCLIVVISVNAKKQGNEDNGNHDNGNHEGHDTKVIVVEKREGHEKFSNDDRDIIIKYFEQEHKKVPPGQAKKRKHYRILVGRPASVEVIRVAMPLPPLLLPLLPPPLPGIEIFITGDQIIRMNKQNKIVIDCFPIPFPFP